MYSALKRDGVPLYRLARRGVTVQREKRNVQILELQLLRFASPLAELRIRCTKGTYIRVLAEDIGAALGAGAHLRALRRTASGRFRVENALPLEALEGFSSAGRESRLLPLAEMLGEFPRAELAAADEARLRNGQALKISGLGRAETDERLVPLRLTQAAEKHR